MKTMLFISLGLILGAFLVAGFFGCQRGRAHGFAERDFAEHKAARIKKEMTEKLELTEPQVAEIDRVMGTLKAKHTDMHDLRQDLRAEFFDELRNDQVTPEQIRHLIESRRPVFDEMITVLSQGIADVHAVLTPEQREKLIAELETRSERCRWGRRW